MWNKLDYLTTRNGSGNQVVWNKVHCSTKCRFFLYLVYNIFLSVEDYIFYLKHLSLYDNLRKEIKIITFVAVLNYAVNIRDKVHMVEWLHDWLKWAKRLCSSHSTVPGYLSGSAYNNYANPEDSRCSALDSNTSRLIYRYRSLQLLQSVLCALRILVSFVTMGSFICYKWTSRLVIYMKSRVTRSKI